MSHNYTCRVCGEPLGEIEIKGHITICEKCDKKDLLSDLEKSLIATLKTIADEAELASTGEDWDMAHLRGLLGLIAKDARKTAAEAEGR